MTDEWMLAFAGEGNGARSFDRAAHLRGDGAWQAGAQVLPVWRGKLLLDDAGNLAWLAPGHPALEDALPPMLLGVLHGRAVATQDMSAWAPPNMAETQLFLDPTEQRHPEIDGARFAELRGAMAALSPAEGELAATARALTGWHATHRFCAACGQPSEPVQSGWQRRCTACGASHFPRTDPVVIMLVEREDRLLLGRSPGWPEGMYSCLAGFIEPGETVEAAVRREVFEETAVRTGEVRHIVSQPWPFPASLMLGCAAEALTDEITLDTVELEDALWVSRSEVAQIMGGEHPKIRPPRKGPIAGWLIAGWLSGTLGATSAR
ncbi:NAD(+) diphosphatase [Paracoccus sp. Z118]|uniref:NAD(+) diphosphatase n=1 Tax=Paracoccus sp. Z118 TaxID=2851017 RepID=UPI0020B81B9F|nr:NAD(+) diphosphatase [Paracoccus sp. Z118]